MPDQAPRIEPGSKGRLRYDKARRTIVGESRTVHDPFLNQDVQVSSRLTDRLRGKYANGPTIANGEPEFGWREFPTPPIQHDAAAEIERLQETIRIAAVAIEQLPANSVTDIEIKRVAAERIRLHGL